jgi:alpha-aminoadipate carrier protein LysW
LFKWHRAPEVEPCPYSLRPGTGRCPAKKGGTTEAAKALSVLLQDGRAFYFGRKTHVGEIAMAMAMAMAVCPECEANVPLDGRIVGEILYCPDCNAELEVLDLSNPTVGLAPQVEEDWGE